MRTKKFRWFAVFIWMIVIFAFSHQAYSGRETEKYLGDANIPVRKAGHISEYMVLYWLVRWALQKKRDPDTAIEESTADTTSGDRVKPQNLKRIASSPTVIAFLISATYAVSDEWHQSYVPGRSASLADVAWDTCGITIGMILLFSISRIRKSKKSSAEP